MPRRARRYRRRDLKKIAALSGRKPVSDTCGNHLPRLRVHPRAEAFKMPLPMRSIRPEPRVALRQPREKIQALVLLCLQ